MDRTDSTLDLVVLADFMPSAGSRLSGGPTRVDAESLAALLAEARPMLEFPARPGMGRGFTLAVSDYRGFRPEAIAPCMPLAGSLLRVRRHRLAREPLDPSLLAEELTAVGAPSELIEVLGRVLRRPAPGDESLAGPSLPAPPPPRAATEAPRTGLGSIFDLVDLPDERAPARGVEPAQIRALDTLIERITGLADRPESPTAETVGTAQSIMDAVIEHSVRSVLRDSRFRALEAVWLGLRFLLRRLDPRSGTRVHALSCSREELLSRFRSAVGALAESARAEGRMTCALVVFDLGADPRDLEDAETLARLAEEAQVPTIAAADPGLLGLRSLAEADARSDLGERLDDEAHEPWRGLRGLEASRWLALAINRFLLRVPYGAEQDPVRDFAFEENPPGAEACYLWGRAPWALGVLVAASFARTGWGTDILGPGGTAIVGDLPVRPLALRTGEVVQAPLEALLSEPQVLELSRGGIIALACRRNSDAAFVTTAPSVHREAPAGEGAQGGAPSGRASLRFQLFAAQVLAAIGPILEAVDRRRTPEEIAHTLARGLKFLTAAREGPALEVQVEAPGSDAAAVLRVSPRAEPLRGLPDVVLGLPQPAPA